MWFIGSVSRKSPQIVELIVADWAFVFSHWADAVVFFTFFIKAVAIGAEITHDCFASKTEHWINCDV